MTKEQLETQLKSYQISIKVESEKEKDFLIDLLSLNKKRHKNSWKVFPYLENSLFGPSFFSTKEETTTLILAADIMNNLGTKKDQIKQIVADFAANNNQINLCSEATQDLLAETISKNI